MRARQLVDEVEISVRREHELALPRSRLGAAEIGSLVQRRQQREPDARGSRGIDQRLGHRALLRIRRAVRLVVQVVKLAHGGIAGLEHVRIALRRDGIQALGRHAAGVLVHGLAPGPEAVALGSLRPAPLRQPGHRALERVTVYIRHAGNRRAVDQPRGGDDVVRRHVHDVARRVDRNHHVAPPAIGQPGGGEAVAGLEGHAGQYKTGVMGVTTGSLGSSVDRGGPGNPGRSRRHRPRARRCTRDSRRTHRLGRHAGTAAGNVVVRACRDRCARPVDHAGADRMPHAPRVRGRPQQRVRCTTAWCDLRRHRTRRRRNRVDDARHASRQRRGTARSSRCLARRRWRAKA